MIDYIPHFLQYSLNIRGLVSQKCRKNKMSWLKQQLKEIKKLGVIHFQESHFSNLKEIEECFFGMKGKILGVSCNPTNHKHDVFSWVPLESPISPYWDQKQACRTWNLFLSWVAQSHFWASKMRLRYSAQKYPPTPSSLLLIPVGWYVDEQV